MSRFSILEHCELDGVADGAVALTEAVGVESVGVVVLLLEVVTDEGVPAAAATTGSSV